MWGRYGVKERNVDEQSVVDFAKRMEMAVVNTYFKKRKGHRAALGVRQVLPDDRKSTPVLLREPAHKVFGASSGQRKEDKVTSWWNDEVQESIQRKK